MFAAIVWPAAIITAIATQGTTQNQTRPPVEQALTGVQSELAGITAPSASSFVNGDREIRIGTSEQGPIAIIGTLRVAGTITGDAFVYGGDIVMLPGGRITGSAVAIGGRVVLEGGDVEGDVRAVGGSLLPASATSPPASTSTNVYLTLGWASVVLLVGIGVLVFGGPTLDAVGEVVDNQFGRSFLVGIGATLAIVPALGLLVVALVLTVLGILLVPFAIVAYVLAVTGLVTLGFLAAVRITGHSFRPKGTNRPLTHRGASLRALVLGVVFFLGLWLVAAVLTPFSSAQSIARLVAFAITWAAATVGLGATIISRAGTRTANRPRSAPPPPMSKLPDAEAPMPDLIPDWQTPTPITGVAAARRRSAPTGKAS